MPMITSVRPTAFSFFSMSSSTILGWDQMVKGRWMRRSYSFTNSSTQPGRLGKISS